MPFEFSLQTAIAGTLFSSVILSATLCYLWRNDPQQRALLFWSLAFAAQTLRMAAQFGVTLGHQGLWLAIDLLFALVALCLWLGARELEQRPRRLPVVAGLLATALIWEFVVAGADVPFFLRTLPLYASAGVIMLLAAATLFRLARRHPGIGYQALGILLGLLGLHYFDYPFLRNVPAFAPIGFGLAAGLMLMLGIAMLIITQRRQAAELARAAQQLREELAGRHEIETRHLAVVSELDEGIIVVARNGEVLSANPAAARMLAVDLERLRNERIEKRPYLLYHEDGQALATVDYPLRQALHTGKACPRTLYRMERTDGSSLWVSVSAHPLFAAGAETPYAAIAAFSDVSERKAAERHLLASELRFRSIFEGVGNIAVQGYDQQRRVIYWNSASETFYGFTRSEALGQRIEALVIQPEDRDVFVTAFATCIERGQAPSPGEYLARRKDGSSIAIYSTQVLISNLQGEPEVYCIDVDLSAIQRLEREFEEYSERFRALAESSDLGMVVTDENARFVWCNQRYLELIDSTLEEVLDGSWIEHLHPDERAPMRENWRRAVASQTGFVSERRVVNRDGSIQWGQAHATPIRTADGTFRGFVATVEDITARKEAEDALRQSEAKFRATFDQAFQFIGLLSPDGTLLDANRTALAFASIAPDQVIGRPFVEGPWWHSPPERQKLVDAIARARNGEFVRFETRHPGTDGRDHIIDFSLKPVIGSAGHVDMLIPEGRDITELKATEDALRLSEARFSGAFQASLDYITISYLDTGVLIDVNDAFEKITGWAREEAIGRTTVELGIWRDQETRNEAIARLQRDAYVREYPIQLGTRDGRWIDGVLNASIIEASGQRYLLGVVRDISKQKAAEAALRESEEKFSRIVQYSPVALVITDVETGVVLDFNRAWQELLGYSREQAIGHLSADFGLWVDNADRDALYRQVTAGNGELDRFEVRYRCADGKVIYGQVSGRVFAIGGRACYLWSITDITLRHEMEERMAQLNSELESRVEQRTSELRLAQDELMRSEKLAALGALVAGVAHELNTPIGNAVTVASTLHDKTSEFGEMVAEGTLKRSALNGYLDSARTASDLLLRSLNQARNLVASFKQVAVDQTSDQRRTFDLAEVVGEVLTTLSPTMRKTPYAITVDIPKGIVMDSFPGPLGQIITNFVNNAVLHAFDGRRTGNIILRASQPQEGEVRLSVSDDGNGIPEEYVRRIFDPFFTTKLGQGGSGLGLNIVYNIVTSILGGRISVESRVGAGTTFVIKMPLTAPNVHDSAYDRAHDTLRDRNDQRPV